MIFRLRYIMSVIFIGIVGLIGWSGYSYFFDITSPHLHVTGITHEQFCSGDVQCFVASDKSGDISLWLDGQSLIKKFKMGRNQDHPFIIPTKTIANGKHTLKAEFEDRTYNKNKTTIESAFYVDNMPLQAAFVRTESDQKVFQGRTFHVQFQVNKELKDAKVTTLSQTFDAFPEAKNSLIYECFIPITCEEQPNEYLVSVDLADKVGNMLRLDNKFQVVTFPFKKQHLEVSTEKVKQEEEMGPDIQRFEEEVRKITQASPRQKLWQGSFCAPIDIARVTSDFGVVRTTQHRGRYAHKALDVANAPKSVVWATQDGVVVMKDRYAYSGNSVVIDHGWGILSMYFHLDDFAKVNVGDKIAKGSPLGYIGKTGYANGYHLHWEMRVNNVQIDPMQWTKPAF